MLETVPLIRQLRTLCPTISVGILTANWMNLEPELCQIEQAGVKLLHFDVMDGRFCPMLTMGPPLIKAVKTSLLKDVHLMIEDPLAQLDSFISAGADMVTINVEFCRHPHRVLQALGKMTNANAPERGLLRGIALNPGTPLDVVDPLLDEADMVFLLAVNPGWSGQSFISSTPRRVAALLDIIRRRKKDILVGLDGGVTRQNIDEVSRLGADIIVTGSAVFDGKAAAQNAGFMLKAVARAKKV
ncbi:MAG: ribulose-phosphate 3-epimerase [Kiritimatiellia bacterium]|nr:ribulose-phosphate 3-epimerase [Kiritimatiellia bacterium]